MITVPSIRRALQELLAPRCRHDCEYCRQARAAPDETRAKGSPPAA